MHDYQQRMENIEKYFRRFPETRHIPAIFKKLPVPFQGIFINGLEDVVDGYARRKDINEKGLIVNCMAVEFEMSRVAYIIAQGFETADAAASAVLGRDRRTGRAVRETNFFGYSRDRALRDGPDRWFNHAIQNDVAMSRPDGKGGAIPYIYETKHYTGNKYGSKDKNWNQLLKYQKAFSDGFVGGVCLEVRGRIDAEFMRWALAPNSLIPDIHLIYSVPLPSGAEYRLIIKPARDTSTHLNFVNDNAAYTALDKQIIAGVTALMANPSSREALFFLGGDNIKNPSPEAAQLLLDPDADVDVTAYRQFNDRRVRGMWELALMAQLRQPGLDSAAQNTTVQALAEIIQQPAWPGFNEKRAKGVIRLDDIQHVLQIDPADKPQPVIFYDPKRSLPIDQATVWLDLSPQDLQALRVKTLRDNIRRAEAIIQEAFQAATPNADQLRIRASYKQHEASIKQLHNQLYGQSAEQPGLFWLSEDSDAEQTDSRLLDVLQLKETKLEQQLRDIIGAELWAQHSVQLISGHSNNTRRCFAFAVGDNGVVQCVEMKRRGGKWMESRAAKPSDGMNDCLATGRVEVVYLPNGQWQVSDWSASAKNGSRLTAATIEAMFDAAGFDFTALRHQFQLPSPPPPRP